MTLVYLFLGMIMDELPMIMLTVPIFWPIAQALGFDVVWFGIYIILSMELGAISPPVGLNCFIISGVAKDVPLSTIYKGALPFMLTIFVGIALLVFAGLCLIVFTAVGFLIGAWFWGIVIALPCLLCGLICLLCEHNIGLKCAWAVYLLLWVLLTIVLMR
jgi:hypothetical protein